MQSHSELFFCEAGDYFNEQKNQQEKWNKPEGENHQITLMEGLGTRLLMILFNISVPTMMFYSGEIMSALLPNVSLQ